jgi:hypothetical protein
VDFDGADDPGDLQEMRSQLVERMLAYKGQSQCIKQFDGSNDYGSICDASTDDVTCNGSASLDATNAFQWRESLQFLVPRVGSGPSGLLE